MHYNIYEISRHPIPDDEQLVECELPDHFVGTIAEYVEGKVLGDQRELALAAFAARFRSSCERNGDEIRFASDAKTSYFYSSHGEFCAMASVLKSCELEWFSGQKHIPRFNEAYRNLTTLYENKFCHYVYDRDYDDFKTFDAWVRELDTGTPYFFGAVLDYKY